MKIFESEVSTGNASGKAGVPSIPFGRGFYQSGNNGAFGTTFTPSGEPTSTTYKSMKHSKKNLKKKMKKIKLYEDATATAGNTSGMGNVVAAIPSSTPGDVAGSTPGSGDIGQPLGGAFMKSAPNLRKRKDGKYKMKKIKSYDGFNPLKESEEIDNFTAKYYDNFDDEDDSWKRNGNLNEKSKGKQIYLNNPVANMVSQLNPGEESETIDNFRKFDKMIETLLSEFKTRKIVGNTTSDLGNYIGQTIYEFFDDDYFSEEDFISGFEHGVDSMKEPSKSKWHNF